MPEEVIKCPLCNIRIVNRCVNNEHADHTFFAYKTGNYIDYSFTYWYDKINKPRNYVQCHSIIFNGESKTFNGESKALLRHFTDTNAAPVYEHVFDTIHPNDLMIFIKKYLSNLAFV